VTTANSAKVITNTSGSRGITIKEAIICGDGIMDIFEDDSTMNLNSVASGNRWDMIVLRRTWNATIGASTSIYTVIEGSSSKSLPARNNNPGVIADQPIALCRVSAGQTAVQEIIDLRVWAHNGGMYAKDDLVRSYITAPGTCITIGDVTWVRRVTNGSVNDSTSWIEVGRLGSIDLFGVGSSLTGGVSVSKNFLIQAGTTVQDTDANGYARLTFDQPFPNGLLTVIAMNGDDFAVPRAFPSTAGGTGFGTAGSGNKNQWVYRLLRTDGGGDAYRNRHHRINWIAIGW
jgi:hypothetical protein